MVRGLSRAEYNADNKIEQLADKLAELGLDEKAVSSAIFCTTI